MMGTPEDVAAEKYFTPPEEILIEQIKVVALARQKAQQVSEAKIAARVEWENQNRSLLEEAVQTAQVVVEAENKLRELTLQAYTETGNKAPAPGVGIREVTKLEYNPQNAFQWAVEHKMALKLDTSAFEKIVKASPLAFVKIITEPQATISTNLGEYLNPGLQVNTR